MSSAAPSQPAASGPAGSGQPTTATHRSGGTMGGFEVLAQSLAGIAPSAVMATGPALVALGAGDAILYSYLVSTVILLMVGWCISKFTARHGAGTLLSYVTSAFGPGAGFIGAVGLAFGYVLIGVGSVAGFTLYLAPLLQAMGIPGAATTAVAVLLEVVCVVLAAFAMIRGVEVSTRVGVVLEIISIVAILVVVVAVLATQGLSSAPLQPQGLGISGVAGGMVLAILGYVGFESAANMGAESRNPKRSVPRAVLGSVVIAGVLYLISGYAQLVGFGGGAGISESAAPFNDLADSAGVHPLGYLVDVGATASFFACVTGSLNAAARLVASMGRSRLLPASLATNHPTHKTPATAILVLSGATLVIALVMTLSGIKVVEVFAYAGTIGTFGYMLSYILICIGTPIFLSRVGAPVAASAVVGGLAALGMLYVAFRSVYPVQAFPFNILPVIFLAVVVVAAVWYAVLRARAGGPVTIDMDDDVVDLRDADVPAPVAAQ